MKLLLDIQCWLWWFAQPERLNKQATALIADDSNELWFSVASIWEIAIKVANGKLPLPETVDTYIDSRIGLLDMRILEIKACHALRAAALPLHHKDPFDRILIAQAHIEDMTLLSADRMFRKYHDISLIWAAS
ncbi:MAG: type II toxin-antitoxin system VapC family toxin [Chroococcales cyanobacterium]